MSLKRTIDTTQEAAGDIERRASAILPGWYRARIDDVFEADFSGTGADIVIVFKLLDGDREMKQTLFDPASREDTKKAKQAQQRIDSWAVRIGLLSRDLRGQVAEYDWIDAIGRIVVLDVEAGEPKDGRIFMQPKYMGVYSPDDERVPEAIRKGAIFAPPQAPGKKTTARGGQGSAGNGHGHAAGEPTLPGTEAASAQPAPATAVRRDPLDDL